MNLNTDRVRQAMEAEQWRTVDALDGYESFEAISLGDGWLTPGGEVVLVTGLDVDASAEGTEVTVEFLDREAPDGGAYEYTTSAASLLARMDADGGWDHVQPTLYTSGAVNCPVCGAFMSLMPTRSGSRDEPFAVAQCQDGHLMKPADSEVQG